MQILLVGEQRPDYGRVPVVARAGERVDAAANMLIARLIETASDTR
jgi:hypothetical protein